MTRRAAAGALLAVLLSAALVTQDVPAVIRIVSAIPLLVGPAVLLANVLIARRTDGVMRLATTAAVGIAIPTIGIVAIGLAGLPIGAPQIATWMAGVATLAAVAAIVRPLVDAGPAAIGAVRVGMAPTTLPLLAGAALIVTAGLLINGGDVLRRTEPLSTRLWMTPVATAPDRFVVGVTRHAEPDGTLRVQVDDGTRTQEWTLDLDPGETWETTWTRADPDAVVEVRLFGPDGEPIRTVRGAPLGS